MAAFLPRALFIAALIPTGTVAVAQTTVFSRDRFWSVASTSGTAAKDELVATINGREIRKHMSPLGKPCLSLAATSRQVKFGNAYEHVIEAKNSCSALIVVDICYYQTAHCASLTTPSYGKAGTILGVAPAMKDFKYQYREQF
jgi:hypothetical protein